MISAVIASPAPIAGEILMYAEPASNNSMFAKPLDFKTLMLPPGTMDLPTAKSLPSIAVVERVTSAQKGRGIIETATSVASIESSDEDITLRQSKTATAGKSIDADDDVNGLPDAAPVGLPQLSPAHFVLALSALPSALPPLAAPVPLPPNIDARPNAYTFESATAANAMAAKKSLPAAGVDAASISRDVHAIRDFLADRPGEAAINYVSCTLSSSMIHARPLPALPQSSPYDAATLSAIAGDYSETSSAELAPVPGKTLSAPGMIDSAGIIDRKTIIFGPLAVKHEVRTPIVSDWLASPSSTSVTTHTGSSPAFLAQAFSVSDSDLRDTPWATLGLTTSLATSAASLPRTRTIAASADTEAQPASIAVKTPALGTVGADIRQQFAHGREALHIHFAVDRASTAALIADGAFGLDRALATAGLRLDAVSVELNGRGTSAAENASANDSRSLEGRARQPPEVAPVPIRRPAQAFARKLPLSNDRFA